MEILLYVSWLVVSLAVLLKASDWFIGSAEKIGLFLGISPFIIGVTIIAFGTSLPELASSLVAVYDEQSEIVIGNVLGSNITNITLILGFVAVVGGKIPFGKGVIHTDMPLLITSVALFTFVIWDRNISLADGIILALGLVIFLVYSFTSSDGDEKEEHPKPKPKTYFFLILGGLLVWQGADQTIFAIAELSKQAGISPEIIAQSVIALGTSLPELIVSIAAARRGRTEIAVGNVLGSNIFNTYAVTSIPSFFGDIIITEDMLQFSLPFMIAVSLIFAIMCLSQEISRWEGWTLLLVYGFFIFEIFSRMS